MEVFFTFACLYSIAKVLIFKIVSQILTLYDCLQ